MGLGTGDLERLILVSPSHENTAHQVEAGSDHGPARGRVEAEPGLSHRAAPGHR
jgi:hypothetical protein